MSRDEAVCSQLRTAKGGRENGQTALRAVPKIRDEELGTGGKKCQDIKISSFSHDVQRVLELENSLQTSKRQLEELKKQLKKEETHKQTLERELLEDQKKIKELEEKYNLHKTKSTEQGGGVFENDLKDQ
uniref:Uncharacterized protein n=1 Tax=Timema monikensis TaxID=170555 RepID=A0A7R9HSL3_9NEOP|nr:unnamed protein product [Timema monikensis]